MPNNPSSGKFINVVFCSAKAQVNSGARTPLHSMDHGMQKRNVDIRSLWESGHLKVRAQVLEHGLI